jgi:type II secretory pathway component PulM
MARKAGVLMKPVEALAARALELLSTLQPRERLIVVAASGALAVFVLFAGVVVPLVHYQAKLEKSIASKDAQLHRIYAMSGAVKGLKKVVDEGRQGQQGHFTLFGFLEGLAVRLSVNDRIEYMKPITDSTNTGRETVEVKIRGLYMEDLLGLLLAIESSGQPITIKHMNIKRQEKDANLDVTFQVVLNG